MCLCLGFSLHLSGFKDFIYLRGRVTERERSSIQLLTPQMAAAVRAEPIRNQEPLGLPRGCRARGCGPPSALPGRSSSAGAHVGRQRCRWQLSPLLLKDRCLAAHVGWGGVSVAEQSRDAWVRWTLGQRCSHRSIPRGLRSAACLGVRPRPLDGAVVSGVKDALGSGPGRCGLARSGTACDLLQAGSVEQSVRRLGAAGPSESVCFRLLSAVREGRSFFWGFHQISLV